MTRGLEMRIGGRQAIFCLLLIAVLLYNPFFTILSISQEFSVQHTLSYRATLAGSELRRCTFEAAQPLIPAMDAIVSHTAERFAPSREGALLPAGDPVGHLSLPLCDSIWFRPPPAG